MAFSAIIGEKDTYLGNTELAFVPVPPPVLLVYWANLAMLSQVLNGVVAQVQTLGLSFGGEVIPVVKRKAPKREPVVDFPTMITVCKAEEKERVRYIGFGQMSVMYPIEITIVSPNDDDYTSNLDTYTEWREEIRQLFQPPFAGGVLLPGVPAVWDLRMDTDKFLDRTAMAHRFDEMTLVVRATATV